MHHASAAGSRSPTPSKSAPASQITSQSSAGCRQALADMDLNQRPASLQPSRDGLQTSNASLKEQQAVRPKQPQQQHQLAKQQQRQMPGGHVRQQHSQEAAEHRPGAGSRQSKQLRWAETKRQPDAQMLYNSPQAAPVRYSHSQPDDIQARSSDPDHQQQTWDIPQEVVAHDIGHAAGVHQTHSNHSEELQVLAQMLAPTAVVQTDQPYKASHPHSTQHSTPAHTWGSSQDCETFWNVASVQDRCPGADEDPRYRQHALQTARHMQLQSEQPCVSDSAAAYQRLAEQPAASHGGTHLGVSNKAQHEAHVHFADMRELPAGIPLTPVLAQHAKPRDSLEASIWKLSGGSRSKQMTAPGRSLPDVLSPIRYASVQHDSLLESLRALAERQQMTGHMV